MVKTAGNPKMAGRFGLEVREIALRITGADEEEVEVDTPLMEAGLTSNSAAASKDHFQLLHILLFILPCWF